MKSVHGDLLSAFEKDYVNVIVHGCNCFCIMGAGIAKTIKQKYPIVYKKDLETEKGSKSKLGTINYVEIDRKTGPGIIINAYTQYEIGTPKHEIQMRYKAIESCFNEIYKKFPDKRIGIPKIGCGLAGLEWKLVRPIIEEQFKGDITLFYI